MTEALFADAHVQLGFGDPGGLNPITLEPANPITDRWYDLLPECYRLADEADTSTATGWPLYAYMDSVCSVLVAATATGERIADGHLTSPSLADDAWVPWLAQAVGVAEVGVPAMRAALANLVTVPALGSKAHLAVVVQQFLTGTKDCEVTSVPPWTIRIRVRGSEISAAVGSSTTGLQAAVLATGKVPAGYALQVTTASQTWDQVEAGLPTWDAGEGDTWDQIESIGLAGAGLAAGGVAWAGSAAGDAP